LLQPRALLLDLDDTILDDSSLVDDCWAQACASRADRLGDAQTAALVESIRRTSEWYWSDPERHRQGRLSLDATRCEVVRLALAEIGLDDRPLAQEIGGEYARRRDVGMTPLPQAIDTVRWLRHAGCRLALLTNGGGPAQWAKIKRFGLAELFDIVLVEGDVGYGKPDPRIYVEALRALDAPPADAWMVGDNLEWDVVAPQKLGIRGIWIDARSAGLPVNSLAKPDRIIRALRELREPWP
jgi:putative hydrolase of the HAD superfamily